MSLKADLKDFLAQWHSESPFMEVHTSGSTGKPKCMEVEKSKMLKSAQVTCDFLHLSAGQTALLCLPLEYIAGKMVVVRSLEWNLRLLVVEPTNRPLRELSEVPNFAAMVPSQVLESLKYPDERELLKQIDCLIIGGGSISSQLQQKLKDFPHEVWSTYGMTETLSHIALRRLNGADASDCYVPFPEVQISLSDEDCLTISAPWAVASPLITNDIAEINGDGTFRILGRKDNVICSGGIKIQIEEVELALRPFISQPFLITSQPDPKFGEVVVLLVTSPINEASIQQLCKKALPKYWIPKYIYEVDSIPLTATQKPARKRAKDLALYFMQQK